MVLPQSALLHRVQRVAAARWCGTCSLCLQGRVLAAAGRLTATGKRRFVTSASISTPEQAAVEASNRAGDLDMKRKRLKCISNMAKVPRHAQSAVGGPAKEDGQENLDAPKGTFRFWHEERRFKGSGERCIVQSALFSSGGVRTGGYPKTSPIPGPLGAQRPSDWDLLWAPARLALKAAPNMQPGQLISACPGLMSLTRKRKLPLTLKHALGEEEAATIMPRSFSLPDELPAWRAWLAAHPNEASKLWMLKTAQHLGKGLKLLPGARALAEAVQARHVGAASTAAASLLNAGASSATHVAAAAGMAAAAAGRPKPYVVAQRYMADPLLINGRKSGIRVWVLVTGVDPLRAYLHTNGLVLFSTAEYDSNAWHGEGSAVGLGHITNYAQNVDGTVWDLHQLEQHLGTPAFQQLWVRITRSCALTAAAALGPMRAEHRAMGVPANGTFEVLGLDFLIDSALHPWLLEVNGTPSLAVDHADPVVEASIRMQKEGMVHDTFSLLGLRERFKPRYTALKIEARARAQLPPGKGLAATSWRLQEALNPVSDEAITAAVARELSCLGKYICLMPYFPEPIEATGADEFTVASESADNSEDEEASEPAGSSGNGGGSGAAESSDVNNQCEDGEVTGNGSHRAHNMVISRSRRTGIPWGPRDLQLRAAMQQVSAAKGAAPLGPERPGDNQQGSRAANAALCSLQN